jgi:hypothetical protein
MNDAVYSTLKQYDAGVLGGVLLHPPFLDAIGRPQDEWTIPMITASYDLAACVTAVAIVPFTFQLGRSGTIILGNLVAIFGVVVQALSYRTQHTGHCAHRLRRISLKFLGIRRRRRLACW